MNLNSERHHLGGEGVYFSNIKERLLEHLKEATRVYGCIAWLTEKEILETLRSLSVCIIVQGEDWSTFPWSEAYHRYQSLKAIPFSYFAERNPNLTCKIPNSADKAIRSIGSAENRVKMHHKFLIIEKVIFSVFGRVHSILRPTLAVLWKMRHTAKILIK